MKNLLICLFVCLLAFGCSKKDAKSDARFNVEVKQDVKLSTGEISEQDISSFIYVWKADGKNLDPANSVSLRTGFVVDKNTNTSVKHDYVAKDSMSEKVPAGHYFVAVIRDNTGEYSTFCSSYTFFDVKDNEYLQLKKLFTTHVISGQFEAWDQAE